MEAIRYNSSRLSLSPESQLLVLKFTLYLVSAFIFTALVIGFPTFSYSESDYSKNDTIEAYVAHLVSSTTKNYKRSRELAKHIVKEAKAAGYDPLFIASIVKAESTFNPLAKSTQGALGLMQILPPTGKYISDKTDSVSWNGTQALTDPEYNLKLGLAYLKYLESYFGTNKEYVLIAYNWGPANLQKAIG
ncbi:MAG: lytic transglycosylase domain-containing protein, partial [Bdellovibrionales bacterium]|nr:lytic transglycosylase domain-containing protein [Bdellovibrionales bacterium]